jgi:hypothetical protein
MGERPDKGSFTDMSAIRRHAKTIYLAEIAR